MQFAKLFIHGNNAIQSNITETTMQTTTLSNGIINNTMKDITSSYRETFNFTNDLSNVKIIKPSNVDLKKESKHQKIPMYESDQEKSNRKFKLTQNAGVWQVIFSQTPSSEEIAHGKMLMVTLDVVCFA